MNIGKSRVHVCVQKERCRKNFWRIQQLQGRRCTAQTIRMMDKVIARQTKDWTRFSVDTLTSLMTPLHDRTKLMANKQKYMGFFFFFFGYEWIWQIKVRKGEKERKKKTHQKCQKILEETFIIMTRTTLSSVHSEFIWNAAKSCTFQTLPRTGWRERRIRLKSIHYSSIKIFFKAVFTMVEKGRQQPMSLSKKKKTL